MSDDRQEPPEDATRRLPPAVGGPDETAPLGRTPEEAAPEETAPVPPTQRSGAAAWSGRAEVPSVRPGADRETSGNEWYADEPAGRPWFLPILWGVVLLLLLGLLGVGLWLARQALDEGGSTPQSPQPTTQPAPTTASASPTTRSPSPAPTTSSAVAQVPVPPLVGLPEAAARAMLEQLGLDYRMQYRPSDRPAGTVIATEPEAGQLVEAGDEVTLVVAAASPSPSATTGTPTSSPSTEPTATASPTG
ncbi:PASTA domain-containing protein [Micromonospora sp. CA-263727]|uniref:PASTA domain-containing protein n=1 Tax=Micromonospora sp. CA-263727 TaxID=3239967 RepID=UPI003D90C25D